MGFLPKRLIQNVTTRKNNAIQRAKSSKLSTKISNANIKIKASAKLKMKNAIQSKGFLVLLPYKPVMIRVLKKRGHPVSNNASIKTISILFYDAIILGRKNFDYGFYNKINNEPNYQNIIGAAVAIGSAAAPSVQLIVQSILDMISGIGKKKDSGQALTEDEKMLNDADEKIEADEKQGKTNSGDSKNWFQKLIDSIFGNNDKENFRRRIDSRNTPVKVMTKTKPVVITQRPFANATETALVTLANAPSANSLQSYRRAGVASANDIYNVNKVVSRYKPNIFVPTKDGKGFYTDGMGKKIGNYDENFARGVYQQAALNAGVYNSNNTPTLSRYKPHTYYVKNGVGFFTDGQGKRIGL